MNHTAAKINHFITWILTSTFYAFQMVLRIMPVIMLDYLAQKVGFNATQLGLLAGTYYIGYCIAHIPIGLLLDRFQPRYIIAGCLMICVSGLYIKIYASTTFDLFFARFLIGFGSAAGILGSIKVICDFYRPIFGIMVGLTISIGILGACYGAEPIRALLISLTYEQVVEGLILFGIMIAASIIAFYSRAAISVEKKPILTDLAEVFQNKKLLYIGICSGLMVGPLEGFADFWGSNYLVQIHHLTKSEAAYSIGMIFIGLGIGCPIFGYLSNHFRYSTKVIAYLGILMLITITTLFYFEQLNHIVVYVLCFLIGLFSSYQVLSFIAVQKMETSSHISISIALLNMIIMLFGFIYHGLIGFILDAFFISSTTDAMVYGADAYQTAFSVILVGIIIGIVGFWSIKK